MTTRALRWILCGLVLGGPGTAQAQPVLDRVDSLTAAGRIDEARRTLEAWWNGSRGEASRLELQRGLWLRARLTLESEPAELDYRRLAVEYPGGPYSDGALLRLGQAAAARGDARAAADHFRTLVQDYPGSPHRLEAQAWLGRRGEEDEGTGETAAPVRFAIQLGAFSSAEGAQRLMEQTREMGLRPRLVRVPGSRLYRVRVGRFPDAPSAEAALRRVRARGLEATLAADASRERGAGSVPDRR